MMIICLNRISILAENPSDAQFACLQFEGMVHNAHQIQLIGQRSGNDTIASLGDRLLQVSVAGYAGVVYFTLFS